MVLETSASIRGAGGSFQVLFERGVDIRVRELELRRIAGGDPTRKQPEGTSLHVSGSDTSNWSTFVMMINVLGGDVDRNALFDVHGRVDRAALRGGGGGHRGHHHGRRAPPSDFDRRSRARRGPWRNDQRSHRRGAAQRRPLALCRATSKRPAASRMSSSTVVRAGIHSLGQARIVPRPAPHSCGHAGTARLRHRHRTIPVSRQWKAIRRHRHIPGGGRQPGPTWPRPSARAPPN